MVDNPSHVALKKLLDAKYKQYQVGSFIAHDPIQVPKRFVLKQDIEIAGFFAAIFAWGQRTTIINKANELMQRMDNAPFEYVKQAKGPQLKALEGFVHRTFNDTDVLAMVEALRLHYEENESLETAFLWANGDVEQGLNKFYNKMKGHDFMQSRTLKHIGCPQKQSACKRLNMYLRWMVRDGDVDFGIWSKIPKQNLIIPLDVHVMRVALNLNLLDSDKGNWKNAVALTQILKTFDPNDPVKYDFALFSMGVLEKQ